VKRPVPVIGKLDSRTGEARGVKLSGEGATFIDCPRCGERLDKEDLAGLLEHEEGCAGSASPGPPR
jgi:hypothetical protein